MDNIAGSKASLTWAVHLSVALLVVLWIFPTLGLFVSSFRTSDQIATSGWWKAMFPSEQNLTLRAAAPETQVQEGSLYVIEGNLFEGRNPAEISVFGISSKAIDAFKPGEAAELRKGGRITVQSNGDYRLEHSEPFEGKRGPRVFATATTPPEFTLANYDTVLGKDVVERLFMFLTGAAVVGVILFYALRASTPDLNRNLVSFAATFAALCVFVLLAWLFGLSTGTAEGAQTTDSMANAFFSTLTVTIPATVIPIVIAAFAAYALAWMDFPGRAFLIAAIVALLVVPLQLALIPLLSLHGLAAETIISLFGTAVDGDPRRFEDVNALGHLFGFQPGNTVNSKGYLGVWLAHTGFGLPLAIYLLRNYMVGLPRDIIENAKVDGASEFQIFTKIILPLSFPALAAFAIFQFLWTWNDLLVAKVFLIDATGETTVMTNQIVEMLGTRGGNWEILATAAFVSIAVPLVVFFAMQKYLVRGLLAGSVK